MRKTLQPWPVWAEKSLQGLAFWIGYRHTLYAGHPLPECALVAHECDLIYAHLDGMYLVCERLCGTLVPDGKWPDELGKQSRSDLVVLKHSPNTVRQKQNIADDVFAVIVVKRASAAKDLIDHDLQRLAALKAANPKIRAMLFLVSQMKRPSRFVNNKGMAILGAHEIPKSKATYRVRRACKATAAFTKKDSAHYACMIEVF